MTQNKYKLGSDLIISHIKVQWQDNKGKKS